MMTSPVEGPEQNDARNDVAYRTQTSQILILLAIGNHTQAPYLDDMQRSCALDWNLQMSE